MWISGLEKLSNKQEITSHSKWPVCLQDAQKEVKPRGKKCSFSPKTNALQTIAGSEETANT